MPAPRCLVRFTIFSVFDTLDLIQVVSVRGALEARERPDGATGRPVVHDVPFLIDTV